MLYGQQADRHDRDAARAGTAHFQAATRPIRQAMIEAEVWRVHRRSGEDAQTVSVCEEHYKNRKSGLHDAAPGSCQVW